MKSEKKTKCGMRQRQLGWFINRLSNEGGVVLKVTSQGPDNDLMWEVEYYDAV